MHLRGRQVKRTEHPPPSLPGVQLPGVTHVEDDAEPEDERHSNPHGYDNDEDALIAEAGVRWKSRRFKTLSITSVSKGVEFYYLQFSNVPGSNLSPLFLLHWSACRTEVQGRQQSRLCPGWSRRRKVLAGRKSSTTGYNPQPVPSKTKRSSHYHG